MARTFLTPIDLAQNEIQNAVAQNLAAAPATPRPGQFYFDSAATPPTLYWWDGTVWVPAKGTDSATVDAAIDAKVDAVTIVAVPSTSLSVTESGSSATGNLTYTLTLDSLTLANTFTGAGPPDPVANPGEPGDLYIDTTAGTAYISDGTQWLQLEAPAGGVGAVNAGNGIAVDNSTPAAPVVSVVVDPASDPLLTVSATGISLATTVVSQAELDAAIAAIPAPTPIVAGNGLTDTAGTFAVGAGNGIAAAADAVSVVVDPASDPALSVGAAGLSLTLPPGATPIVAGAGLTDTASTFDIVATDASLLVAADSVGVQIDPVAGNALVLGAAGLSVAGIRKFAQAAPLPAGIATPLNHGLNTTDVIVQVFDSTTGAQIEVDVKVLSATQVSLTSTAAVSINVVVIG